MGDMLTGLVMALRDHLEDVTVLTRTRWQDPQPGQSVVVVRSDSDWTGTLLFGARMPLIECLVYSAPKEGQTDAEELSGDVVDRVRSFLHRPGGVPLALSSGHELLSSRNVSRSVSEPEGQPGWSLTLLKFETVVA